MDRQLQPLETWRAAACVDYLGVAGIDPAFGCGVFETLAVPLTSSVPTGAYPDDRSADHVAELPPWVVEDQWRAGEVAAVGNVRQSHSSTRQLRSLDVATQQSPIVLAGRFLRIPTYGAFVTRSQSILAVRRKKQVVFECPFADLSHVSIEWDGVAISTRVLEECARRRISVTVSKTSGMPVARILPARSELHPGLVERQVSTRQTTSGTAIARAIVGAKIANQRTLLLYHAKYRHRDPQLRNVLRGAATDVNAFIVQANAVGGLLTSGRTRLFVIEARAAAQCWVAFRRALPSSLGFGGRHGRGAHDVVNKLLNFGYWSLHVRVWSALEHAGLNSYLGLLHTSRRKTPGLVFDAMEEFRQPLVDRVVLSLVGRGARLELNQKGDLTSRTRTLAQQAFARAFKRSSSDGFPMLRVIQRQARALARAIASGSPYRPYRSTW